MIDKAIAKITDECKGKDYLIPFEEYLTSICTNESVAGKIIQGDKTLQGAFDKMKRIASGRKVGNFAYISPEEGFQIIREYYGITDADMHQKDDSDKIDVLDLF